MPSSSHRQSHPARAHRLPRPARSHWAWLVVCLAVAGTLAGLAQNGANPCKSIHSPVLTAPPDANQQMEMREQQQKDASDNYVAANQERKKQISDDSAKLLKLATELKTEVDKTTKDTLSLGVIRKADEIEKLARSVKEKMKLTVGGS
jgi:hypothetical protein